MDYAWIPMDNLWIPLDKPWIFIKYPWASVDYLRISGTACGEHQNVCFTETAQKQNVSREIKHVAMQGGRWGFH